MLKNLLLFLIFVVPFKIMAQGTVSGNIYDYDNKTFPLQNVKVSNLSNSQSVVTKAAGQFTIPAKVGDLLEFSLTGYHTDTLFLINLESKIVFLPSSSTTLREVEIVGAKINPSILAPDPLARPFTRVATDGLQGKGNNDRAGGLLFNLGYGKYRRQQEKIRLLEERDRYQAEINAVFTEAYVSDLVKLKGDDLRNFMAMYRPPEELVKSERPFNYAYYTVKAYHAWLKLSPEERKISSIPKLKAD
ncbi:MAG: carboxypeptidase-like regulatory domain-containing protein [Candidatus Pedobacter colombiensis]|uniref:Carboxypeptidase-like regulatory domain-containing protein n=1 Tax=Candidatus Pedobacter colombiensis TaxID=3121371 RepID=A0AAJ5W908_9SPHI|nr:carboxypeptidase-like regulatory domain-containing protein [Pedobacter sp.]WEK19835.1 MAG: carboxypeptidase-like regulatory domain-containing protein [Pedobacter sp.]